MAHALCICWAAPWIPQFFFMYFIFCWRFRKQGTENVRLQLRLKWTPTAASGTTNLSRCCRYLTVSTSPLLCNAGTWDQGYTYQCWSSQAGWTQGQCGSVLSRPGPFWFWKCPGVFGEQESSSSSLSPRSPCWKGLKMGGEKRKDKIIIE